MLRMNGLSSTKSIRNERVKTSTSPYAQPDSSHLLTEREKEVLHLLAEGRTNKQVATLLDLELSIDETHRANLMHKLNLHNTAEIVPYVVRKGIIT